MAPPVAGATAVLVRGVEPTPERRLAVFDNNLAPRIELFVDVDLYRTNVRTGATECGGKRKRRVFLEIESGRKDCTDRAWYRGSV